MRIRAPASLHKHMFREEEIEHSHLPVAESVAFVERVAGHAPDHGSEGLYAVTSGKTTSFARLSSRSPKKTGCRSFLSPVSSW